MRTPGHPDDDAIERSARKRLRAAIVFGVAAATIEMAALLWVAYC